MEDSELIESLRSLQKTMTGLEHRVAELEQAVHGRQEGFASGAVERPALAESAGAPVAAGGTAVASAIGSSGPPKAGAVEEVPGAEDVGPAPSRAASIILPSGEVAYSHISTGVALVCFSLLGALILRVATQQGLIEPAVGTVLGLFYGSLLLIGPRLWRQQALLTRYEAVLQYCGLLLMPLIVLETFHRNQVMGPIPATAVMLMAGLIAATVAVRAERRGLAMVGLFCAIVAIVGLGFDPAGAAFRAGALVAISALGFGIAHRNNWKLLRSVVVIPSGLALGLAVLMTAHRDAFSRQSALVLYGCSVGLWLVVALNHALRFKKMRLAESFWLAVASLWVTGLGLYYSPGPAVAGGAGCAVLLLGMSAWVARRERKHYPGLPGLVAAGGLLAAACFWWLDPSGLALMIAACCVLYASRTVHSPFLRLCAYVLAGGAALTAVFAGGIMTADRSEASSAIFWGTLLGALQVGFWRVEDRSIPLSGEKGIRWALCVPLCCTFVAWFSALRGFAIVIGIDGDSLRLGESLLLAILAVIAMFTGKRMSNREVLTLGLTGVGLLVARVALRDLFTLTGLQLLLSVVALGFACLATSFVLQRKKG